MQINHFIQRTFYPQWPLEDINTVGLVPLHVAVKSNDFFGVLFLIRNGADINIQSSEKLETPLHLASKKIINILIQKGANVNAKEKFSLTPLHYAVCDNLISIAKILIANGAQIDFQDENGWTPLVITVFKNHFKLFQFLVKEGANIEAKDQFGNSTLHYAAEENKTLMVEQLIENDINSTNNVFETPLHNLD